MIYLLMTVNTNIQTLKKQNKKKTNPFSIFSIFQREIPHILTRGRSVFVEMKLWKWTVIVSVVISAFSSFFLYLPTF